MTQPLIGVDLVPFSRVRELLDPGIGPLLKRYLSAEELTVSRTPDGAPDQARIAGRLAAKEAVFKLLGAVGRPVPWQGIEVLRGPGGRPGIRLSGRAAELARDAGLGPIDVSISHDAGFAIAVAASSTSADRPRASDRPHASDHPRASDRPSTSDHPRASDRPLVPDHPRSFDHPISQQSATPKGMP
ncbi:4'-phosphopantetheinyl transferase superfamily protein [Streptomyces sp. NPDC055721]|uniref:holo-ACP synthase n=1 Tax=Streptomyces sp. NPDC127132 TaxID=3345374 RepID=UPI00362532B3